MKALLALFLVVGLPRAETNVTRDMRKMLREGAILIGKFIENRKYLTTFLNIYKSTSSTNVY